VTSYKSQMFISLAGGPQPANEPQPWEAGAVHHPGWRLRGT
jgi:hypothetical protein